MTLTAMTAARNLLGCVPQQDMDLGASGNPAPIAAGKLCRRLKVFGSTQQDNCYPAVVSKITGDNGLRVAAY